MIQIENFPAKLYAKQVAELFHFAPPTVAFSFVGAMATLAVFYDTGDLGRGLFWFAFATAVMLLRAGVTWSYRHRHEPAGDPRFWARLMIFGNFLAGIQWGLLGTFLYPAEPSYRELYTILVITCYVAGSITAFAPVKWAHNALAWPAAVPAAIFIFFIHDGAQIITGSMALFFVFTVLFYAHKQHDIIADRLKIELQHEAVIALANEANVSLAQDNNELKHRSEVVKRAQQDAHNRVQLLATHVERTLLPVLECDRYMNVLEWNEAAEVMLGYRLTDVRGQNLATLLLPPEKLSNVTPFIEKLFADNRANIIDTLVKTREGQRIPMRLYVTPILAAEGVPLRIAVIMTENYTNANFHSGSRYRAVS